MGENVMTKLQSALLATATFALGAAAVQTLHAASTPAGITVSEINVKDEAAYKEWLPEIQKTIKQAGGEYIAGGFNKTTSLTGDAPPNRVVVIKYPSVDAVKTWWQENKPLADKAEKFANFRIYVVEGIEAK
jgi:uncharacterized protein (DUF1330 family)